MGTQETGPNNETISPPFVWGNRGGGEGMEGAFSLRATISSVPVPQHAALQQLLCTGGVLGIYFNMLYKMGPERLESMG